MQMPVDHRRPQDPNTRFHNVHIAERFLRFKNAPGSTSTVENNPTLIALSQCNFAMQLVGLDLQKTRREILSKARDTGTGAEVSFIDFASFDILLNEFRNVKNAQNEQETRVLPPLLEYIHDRVICRDFFMPAKSMFKKGPVKQLTEIVRPYGITSTDAAHCHVTANMDRVQTKVCTAGSGFPLLLPIEKVGRLRKLNSYNSHTLPSKLFLVIGPADELLCGEADDKLVCKPFAGMGTHKTRFINHVNTVSDQAYTAVFHFAEAGETAHAVLQDAISTCKLYTNAVPNGSVYREAAVIQIGNVFDVSRHSLGNIYDSQGRLALVKIDNFQLSISPEWTYAIFQYTDNLVDASIENNVIEYSMSCSSVLNENDDDYNEKGNDTDEKQQQTSKIRPKNLSTSHSLSDKEVQPTRPGTAGSLHRGKLPVNLPTIDPELPTTSTVKRSHSSIAEKTGASQGPSKTVEKGDVPAKPKVAKGEPRGSLLAFSNSSPKRGRELPTKVQVIKNGQK